MKQLPSNTVLTTWMQLNLLDADNIQKVGMQFYQKQPQVYTYLMDRAEAPHFNPDEKELVLYLGIGVWQMILKAIPRFPTPPKVLPAALEEAEMVNQMLFLEADEAQWQDLIDTHVQPEIMRHLKHNVEEPPHEAEVRPESRVPMIIILTTVLDCLSDV